MPSADGDNGDGAGAAGAARSAVSADDDELTEGMPASLPSSVEAINGVGGAAAGAAAATSSGLATSRGPGGGAGGGGAQPPHVGGATPPPAGAPGRPSAPPPAPAMTLSRLLPERDTRDILRPVAPRRRAIEADTTDRPPITMTLDSRCVVCGLCLFTLFIFVCDCLVAWLRFCWRVCSCLCSLVLVLD
jgi:hypothetical protein